MTFTWIMPPTRKVLQEKVEQADGAAAAAGLVLALATLAACEERRDST